MLYKGPAEYKTNLQLLYGISEETLPLILTDGVKCKVKCDVFSSTSRLSPRTLTPSTWRKGPSANSAGKDSINCANHIQPERLCSNLATRKYVI